jgi:glycerol kinase
MAGILVIDVGTSGVRASVVTPDAEVTHEHHRPLLPDSPAPGLVEFDADALAEQSLSVARAALAASGPVEAVAVANQRASAVVWDRATGEPVGPGLSWQDLRTVGECLVLRSQGIAVAPNHTATKATWLLDAADPDRTRDLCVGTVDSWLVWHLTGGRRHVTDLTNQSVTGLMAADGDGWNAEALEALRIPAGALPEVVDSSGPVGVASALDGSPPITGIAGDQQASMIGQGCVLPGLAKITFGTGAMLDLCMGSRRPSFAERGKGGTFVLAGWRHQGEPAWAIEAIMLSAGTNVEWLRDDLGLIESAEASHEVASSVPHTDGVVYVPALLGLGTPQWDYGARGTLLGLTRGTTRAHVVRAVLEGVAQRGADLVEAAEADSGHTIGSLRVDGGMTANPTFLQALADATQRPVEVSPVLEATTLGAAFLAGLEVGTWSGWEDLAATWRPARVVEPGAPTDRQRWSRAVERAGAWHEELTSLEL